MGRRTEEYKQRTIYAQAKGVCVDCWLPNDRLPKQYCTRCAERRQIRARLRQIALRQAALELEEEELLARRTALLREAIAARLTVGRTHRGRQKFKPQAARKQADKERLHAKGQHPWQRESRISWQEYLGKQDRRDAARLRAMKDRAGD